MRRFDRILTILAAYEREEFDLTGLNARLRLHEERNVGIFTRRPARKQTVIGVAPPVAWSEP